MPLMHGKSQKAFEHNVATEMKANPGLSHRAQNLAIAYSMKRKAAQKKAEGGMVEDEKPELMKVEVPGMEDMHAEHEGDMIDRIMAKHYSMGGRVANDTDPLADTLPNEFDDLVLRDNLESTYGDDNNSGDASGNAQEMEDRRDIVARIMRQRSMKQHNPRPA